MQLSTTVSSGNAPSNAEMNREVEEQISGRLKNTGYLEKDLHSSR